MIWHLLIGFAAGAAVSAAACVIVGRRALRTLQAERAEEMLGGKNYVAGITLPEVDDPRWKPEETQFTTGKVLVLRLADVFVELNGGAVFVGTGPALPNGSGYGNSVIKAYRQRLADKARNLS